MELHQESFDPDFLNSLHDGIMLLSKSHEIIFANVSAKNMLGLHDDKIIDALFEDTVHLQANGEKVSTENSPITKAEKKSDIYSSLSEPNIKLSMARTDRSMLSIEMSVIPAKTKHDVAYTVIFYDSSSDEKIDQAKSEFIALVSHQLRTPINIISWYVEKLLDTKHGSLNESQSSYLQEVQKSNKRVIDLVQAIVNVSRTDLHRLKHKHGKIDLVTVIQKVIAEITPLAESKNSSLVYTSIIEQCILADSDQELIGVSIRNIIQNAIRYSPEKSSIDITLRTPKDSDSSLTTQNLDGYVIEITDKGIGIPDQEKQQIFQKLYRASNVQSLDVTGVGLGLYIAQNFIEELGGRIWFNSELRGGSTFYVFVPS